MPTWTMSSISCGPRLRKRPAAKRTRDMLFQGRQLLEEQPGEFTGILGCHLGAVGDPGSLGVCLSSVLMSAMKVPFRIGNRAMGRLGTADGYPHRVHPCLPPNDLRTGP